MSPSLPNLLVLERITKVCLITRLSTLLIRILDHTLTIAPYIADDKVKTLNPLWRGEPAAWGQALTEWENGGAGIMGAK